MIYNYLITGDLICEILTFCFVDPVALHLDAVHQQNERTNQINKQFMKQITHTCIHQRMEISNKLENMK